MCVWYWKQVSHFKCSKMFQTLWLEKKNIPLFIHCWHKLALNCSAPKMFPLFFASGYYYNDLPVTLYFLSLCAQQCVLPSLVVGREAGWENGRHHRSQHRHWQRNGSGSGQKRYHSHRHPCSLPLHSLWCPSLLFSPTFTPHIPLPPVELSTFVCLGKGFKPRRPITRPAPFPSWPAELN